MRSRFHMLIGLAALASMGGPLPPALERRPAPGPPPKPEDAVRAFHAHLDACRQCRENPMRLCSAGADLAELAGESFGRDVVDTLPPGADTVRVASVDGSGGLASGLVVAGKTAARVMLDDVEPQTYRVAERAPGPSFGEILPDLLPDLPTGDCVGAWAPPRPEIPGRRSTLGEKAAKARKKKNRAAKNARRRNR